jgi:hypothetical protein
MPLRNDLQQGRISPLVNEEGNVAGQPGGGPLAPLSTFTEEAGKRFRGYASIAASAAGDATVDCGGPTIGFAWLVERVAVRGGGTATVYVGQTGVVPSDRDFVDFTPSGTADVADENSPIYVPGGGTLLVVFAGAGALTVCKVNTQVRVVKEG